RIVRTSALPDAEQVTGLPVAPVPRALADAVTWLDDAVTVRRLLTEAVRGGHCDAASVVRELTRARLLNRPHVVDAVDTLVAEGRAIAEDRLYAMVREHGLPDPVWNVDLRLPGGPHLGGLDAYWPEQAVAVELDTRAPRQDDDALWSEYARKREVLERLGITVVHVTPRKLRDAPDQQAAVVRTALMAAPDREPAAYVVVLPRWGAGPPESGGERRGRRAHGGPSACPGRGQPLPEGPSHSTAVARPAAGRSRHSRRAMSTMRTRTRPGTASRGCQ